MMLSETGGYALTSWSANIPGGGVDLGDLNSEHAPEI